MNRKTRKIRDSLLAKGDWAELAKMFGLTHLSKAGQEAGMHKTRIELESLPDEIRQTSLDWLREKGFKRTTGSDLPDTIDKL